MSNTIITDEKFNDFLCNQVVTVLNDANNGNKESFLPLLVVLEYSEDESYPVNVFALAFDNFNDSETRHEVMFEIGRQAFHNKMRPVAVFLSSEAWIRVCKPSDFDPNRRVSEYDDKQEVLIVVGLTIDKRANAVSFPIERDDRNHIHLGPPTFLPYQSGVPNTIEPMLIANFFVGYLQEMQSSRN